MSLFPVIAFLALHLAGLAFFSHLLLSRKSHASMILWTMWLLLFPLLGIPLYLVLGTEKIHRKRKDRFDRIRFPRAETPAERVDLSASLEDLRAVSGNPIGWMEPPRLFWDGDGYYEALDEDVRNATCFIHIQTYVWRNDEIGRCMLGELCDAARRDVDVRVVVDEVGSMKTPRGFFDPLIEAGGCFSWASTVQTRRSRFFFNLRNHRKINVIDGRIAYVGGMNIGNEYAGRSLGPWQDLQMRFRGPVVHELENSFAEDWAFATGEQLNDGRYYPEQDLDSNDMVPVVVAETGPDHADLSFLKGFSILCMHARKRLDLFTPYFVPNEHLLATLQITAARGVRVRLMIPTLNEHKYMVDIGRASYEPLLEHGVEIHELPGMVHHAKVVRVDDELVFAGSHNLDIRSYKLNFELSLCFEHVATAKAMDEHFQELFLRADRIDLETFANRPLGAKLKQGFVRLFGPVL